MITSTLSLNFTSAALDPSVTFLRALNTATRINSSGVIETVNANTPRFNFNPVTLTCRGLLVEETRTNLMLYSSAYNTGVANMWGPVSITFTTGQLAPDGTNTALQCRQDNSTSAVIASGILNEPTITSGATVTYTQYFKYTSTRWLLLQLSPPSLAPTSAIGGRQAKAVFWFAHDPAPSAVCGLGFNSMMARSMRSSRCAATPRTRNSTSLMVA